MLRNIALLICILTLSCNALVKPISRPLQTTPPSGNHVAARIVSANHSAVQRVYDNNTNIDSKEEGACQWFLQLINESNRILDPVNLAEEFQKDNTQVWVKFSGMRRMNRCHKANPVWIQDMVLR